MSQVNPEDFFLVPELDDDHDHSGDGIPADAEEQEGEDT